jgi:uncharacterized lipoprotein
MTHTPSLRPGRLGGAAALVLVLSLAACGSGELARTFGISRDSPDEFTVTTRAPLSMPPDLSLPPPSPGASRPQEQSSPQAAEAALAPQTALAPAPGVQAAGQAGGQAGFSPGEQALLQASGPPAPADIRRTVDQESALDQPGQSFTDWLMFWRKPDQPGVVVDAQKEAQRLRENAALGQSPEQGDTPIIQRKSKSLFDSIF